MSQQALQQVNRPTSLAVGQEHETETDSHAHVAEWTELARVGLVAVAAAAVWFRWYEPFSSFSVIGILATLIGGWPIFREAVENIIERP